MLAGKRVHKEIILAMVTAVLLIAATSRTARAEGTCESGLCYDVEYVNYFSNAVDGNGRGYVRITDPLEVNSSAHQPEAICAMIYVFDVQQGMQECCGCPITRDGLLTLSYGIVGPVKALNGDLNSNPLSVTGQFFFDNSGYMQDGVIRILSTETNASTSTQSSDATSAQAYDDAAGTDEYLFPGVGCNRFLPASSDNCCDPTGGVLSQGYSSSSLTLITTVRAWADHIQNDGNTNTEFEENPISPGDADNLAGICAQTISSGNGSCTCGNEFAAENTGGE